MKRRSLTIRPVAQEEIDQNADYLAARAGETTAERFLSAVAVTFELLSKYPGIGGPWISEHPRLQGIRKYAIHGFPRYLVYYRYDDRAIDVLHLFHGSQDIKSRLDPDNLYDPEPTENS